MRRRGDQDHRGGTDDDRWIAAASRRADRHRPGADPGSVRGRYRRTRRAARRAGREGAQGPARNPRSTSAARREWPSTALGTSRSWPRSTTRRRWRGAALRSMAEYFRSSGADVIDIGCTPGRPFPELAEVGPGAGRVAACASASTRFDPGEITTARRRRRGTGAERQWLEHRPGRSDYAGSDKRFVVIPDAGQELADTRAKPASASSKWRVNYLIDPIVEPIGFGFMASLERYAEAHRRWPRCRR